MSSNQWAPPDTLQLEPLPDTGNWEPFWSFSTKNTRSFSFEETRIVWEVLNNLEGCRAIGNSDRTFDNECPSPGLPSAPIISEMVARRPPKAPDAVAAEKKMAVRVPNSELFYQLYLISEKWGNRRLLISLTMRDEGWLLRNRQAGKNTA